MNGILINPKLESVLNANQHTGIEKKCRKCGEVKELSEFYKKISNKDGLRTECKSCQKLSFKDRYKAHSLEVKEASKKWAKDHPEKIKEIAKKWKKDNPKKVKESAKTWYETHSDKKREANKKWRDKNPDRITAMQKRANDKKSATLKGKLNCRMSNRIYSSLRRGVKANRHWETLVGFTLEELKVHIEKQFKDGMNWGRFMKGEIHIDHKIPISVFNFEKPEDIDFKKAWGLSNLQPLWALDNILKSNKLEKPFQPSLCIGG